MADAPITPGLVASPPESIGPAELSVRRAAEAMEQLAVCTEPPKFLVGADYRAVNPKGRILRVPWWGSAQPLDGWRQIPRAALAFANDY